MLAIGAVYLAMGSGKSLALAKNGKALLLLVVDSENTIPAEKTAVKELAVYLEKITGAKFEIKEEKSFKAGEPAIYIGNTEFARKHIIDPAKMGAEESVLRTVGNSLVLSGGRPRGTLYAVYEFLENNLGCRWYAPWYEKIPSRPTCSVKNLNRRIQPAFSVRDVYTGQWEHRIGEQWNWFVIRNRFNGGTTARIWQIRTNDGWIARQDSAMGAGIAKYGGPHSFYMYFPTNKYFQEHPEYFSEREGKRVPATSGNGNHLCLTNPDVRRLMIEKVGEKMTEFPDIRVFSVSMNDGGCTGCCNCKKCEDFAKRSSWTDLHIDFVNEVADGIKAKFPKNYVYTLAYSYASNPPREIHARDNVIVEVCALNSQKVGLPECAGGKEFDNPKITGWAQYCNNVWAWDYVQWGSHPFMLPLYFRLHEQLKFCRKKGVTGILEENELVSRQTMVSEFYSMRLWLMARLMQDPEQDVDGLIKDYMDGYYGPAGRYLFEYILLQKNRINLWPDNMADLSYIRGAQELFDKAQNSVRNDPALLARVKDARIWLDITTIFFRSKLIDEFVRQGNKQENYPYKTAVVRDRAVATLRETQDPLWRFTYYPKWDKKKALPPIAEQTIEYVQTISQGRDYCPLPEQFRDIPVDRIVDVPGYQLGKGDSKLVEDPESVFGLAICRDNGAEMPISMGIYDHSLRKQLVRGRSSLGTNHIAGSGYHLYKIGRNPITLGCVFWFSKSWQIQKPLGSLHDPQNMNQEWDLYVSVKVAGPSYPHGKPDEKDGLYLDRLILVKTDNEKQGMSK